MSISKEHVHYFRLFNINAEDPDEDIGADAYYPTQIILKVEKDLRGLDKDSLNEFLSFQLAETFPFDELTVHGFDAEEISRTQYSKLKYEEYIDGEFNYLFDEITKAQAIIMHDYFQIKFYEEDPETGAKVYDRLLHHIYAMQKETWDHNYDELHGTIKHWNEEFVSGRIA